MTAEHHRARAASALQRGDFAAALAEAEQGLAHAPAEGALLALGGLCALQQGDDARAEDLLGRQIAVAPTDPAPRTNLAMLLTRQGRLEEALGVLEAHADGSAGSPKARRLLAYLLQENGREAEAVPLYRQLTAEAPGDFELWNNLGNALRATGDTAGAIQAFQRAVHAGAAPEVFLNLSELLTRQDSRHRRLQVMEAARRRFPGHRGIALEYGLALAAADSPEGAVDLLRPLADTEDELGEAHVELGLLYENLNRLDDLRALIESAERRGLEAPELDFLRAWLLRREERFAEAEVFAARVPETISVLRRAQLSAEIADRLGKTGEAFDHYRRMNREVVASRPAPDGPNYRQTIEQVTAEMVAPPPVELPDDDWRDPVFVVGFPRSGTTLLDTLLSGFPELRVFEEKPMLSETAAAFPGLSRSADPALIAAARTDYFMRAERHGPPLEGRWLVDKHPLHMAQMPLIQRLFPRAPIVMIERHPCDVVLSCFMANFTPNFAMRSFTDLEEAARTYDAVLSCWTRACALLPLTVKAVRYEQMIEDLEPTVRTLADFLGLVWRDSVLDHRASAARRGPVRTASYAQIGQPIYRRAVGRWKRYEEELAPIRPVLEPWIRRLGYES
ncbi:tetratricopeptide repeat-containing sulfotransferase family protein [Altericroceibacterium xinjiangense]|uniref:tetratricopeptide repeat-containing sulfotransferase family protein n=1 Tax=Altericroceibacterium xinjiangense TaxID=762261 RepID=UPI000F7EFE2E|nr:tetratricopeptide repeat-containing sulfotransferase family protein [Altericroceibacterium xinjiangense]